MIHEIQICLILFYLIMDLELDLNKTLEQNADDYFNKAKKIRKKIRKFYPAA